jgi:hypothetical protein
LAQHRKFRDPSMSYFNVKVPCGSEEAPENIHPDTCILDPHPQIADLLLFAAALTSHRGRFDSL